MRKRLEIEGYLDMGQPRIPPLPNNIVMTDRASGAQLWLTFGGASASLSPSIPTTQDNSYYGPFDGPYIQDGPTTYRLFSSSGILSIEAVDAAHYVTGSRVICRAGFATTVLEVTAPGGVLTYTTISL